MDNSIKIYVIQGLLLLSSVSVQASAPGPSEVSGQSSVLSSLSAASGSSSERAPLLHTHNPSQAISSRCASSSSSSTPARLHELPRMSHAENMESNNEEALFRADIGQALQISGISAGMKSGKAPQIKWRWPVKLPNDCWPIVLSYLYDTESVPPMLLFQPVTAAERISQEQFDQMAQFQLLRTVQRRASNRETNMPKTIFNADGSLKLSMSGSGLSSYCPVELYRNKKLIFKKSTSTDGYEVNASLNHDEKLVIVTTARKYDYAANNYGRFKRWGFRDGSHGYFEHDYYGDDFDIYEVSTGLNVYSLSSGWSSDPQSKIAHQVLVNKNGVFYRFRDGQAFRVMSPYEDQFKRMPISQKILLGVVHQNYASSGLFSSSTKKASLPDISKKNGVKLDVLHAALHSLGYKPEQDVIKAYNLEVNPKVTMCSHPYKPKDDQPKDADGKCVIL